MSDPVDERLRSYYRAIEGDPPIRLEAKVARAIDAAPAVHRMWSPLRAASGLAATAALLLVIVLVLGGLGPGPVPSPSGVMGPSQSSSATATAVPTEPPTATPGVTAPHEQTPSPSPEQSPTARPVGSLQDTGAMTPPLSQPVAVRLADGRVLITGGREKRPDGITLLRSRTAEIYEAAPGKFTPTGSMADARAGHTATLLNDGRDGRDSRVLVVGGIDASDGFDNLATAELYDPATGKFTRTGSLAQGRAHHTATLLNDGRVLIAGGYGGGTLSLNSAEIFDPSTGKFTSTGSMAVARRDATATLLSTGLVLIAGGLNEDANGARASAELYDPATGKFAATGSMGTARFDLGAMGLEDGRVLVAGGIDSALKPLTSAEFYDPGTGKFSQAGSMTEGGASMAVWLKDARVLFVSSGGLSLYDPASGTFSPVGTPVASVDTATLTDRNVLLTESGPAQVYQP
jgi:hypothetical protein